MSALVLVTGAAGAIGSATVEAFLERGFLVVGIDRDSAVTTRKNSSGYTGILVDLESPAVVVDAIRELSKFGDLAHVVSLAGGALPAETEHKDVLELDELTFTATLRANLVTQFTLIRAVLPLLRANRGDRSISLTSSFNALSGWGCPDIPPRRLA